MYTARTFLLACKLPTKDPPGCMLWGL